MDAYETPEVSEHTSIKKRIEQFKDNHTQPLDLAEFVGNPREPMPPGLPFDFKAYLELVDWTGRHIRDDKRGYIAHTHPPILDRLDIEPDQWLTLTTQFEQRFSSFVGNEQKLKRATQLLDYQRTPGLARCRAFF